MVCGVFDERKSVKAKVVRKLSRERRGGREKERREGENWQWEEAWKGRMGREGWDRTG
jgi:hypothetical protein